MKKTLLMIVAVAAVAFAAFSCAKPYDDSDLRNKITSLETRISSLEGLQTQINELKDLVQKLEGGLKVSKVEKSGDSVTISFSDGTSVTVTKTIIGVTSVDGVYCWTVNGEVIKDPAGNVIPVGTQEPKLRAAADGTLEYSVDGGKTWSPLAGKMETPTVEETDEAYIIHFGESTFTLPKDSPFFIRFAVASNFSIAYGETGEAKYEIAGADVNEDVEVGILAQDEGFDVELIPANGNGGMVKITNNNKTAVSGRIIVYAANHKGKSDIKTFVFLTEPSDEPAEFTAVIDGGVEEIVAEGGTFYLNVKADEDYTVSSDADWIVVSQPTRALYEDRLAITVKENPTTEPRTGNITLRSKESDLMFAVAVKQAAGEDKPELPDGYQESWIISYAGREESTSGTMADWIQVEGWSGDYYDVLLVSPTYADEEFGGDVKAMLADYVAYYEQYLGDYTIEDFNFMTENTYIGFKPLDPGSYTAYLVDISADCKFTGKWSSANFEIEEEEASDEYNALLGWYHMVTGKGRHYDDNFDKVVQTVVEKDVVIERNVANLSYKVYYLFEEEGELYGNLTILDWDRTTGGLSYAANGTVQTWEHSTYGPIDDFQYAYIYYSSDLYYVTGNYTIGQGNAPAADGSFQLTAGPDLSLNIGKTKIVGLMSAGIARDESVEYWWPHECIPFPMTFTPIDEGATATSSIVARYKNWIQNNTTVRPQRRINDAICLGPLRPENFKVAR